MANLPFKLNVVLQNFVSRGSAYGLYTNQYWSSMAPLPGGGVQLSNIQFISWTGIVRESEASQAAWNIELHLMGR